MPEVILVARNQTIEDLVLACAKREINFDVLCSKVHEMGYKTTSLYEMVIATQNSLKDENNG